MLKGKSGVFHILPVLITKKRILIYIFFQKNFFWLSDKVEKISNINLYERKLVTMIFSADCGKLTEAIMNASKVTDAHSSIPALSGILINLKGDVITVTGYDLDSGIKIKLKAIKAEEDGEVVIDAKLISDMLKKMSQTLPVEFECKNQTLLTIYSGKVVFRLIAVSGEKYPNLPEMSLERSFTIKENVLKSMIRQTIFAVAQTDIRPILRGVLFQVKNGYFNMVAMDGTRIALRREKVDHEDLSFVVPTKVLNELLHILSDDEKNAKDITILLDKTQVGFNRDDYITFTRVLDGNYVDYEEFLRNTYEKEAIIYSAPYANALDRIFLLTERFKTATKCTIRCNQLVLECFTNLGSIYEQMQCEYSPSESYIFCFNAKLVLESVRAIDDEKFRLSFSDNPYHPVKLLPMEGDNFLYLVMPVKLPE